jgi:hypothetical protein
MKTLNLVLLFFVAGVLLSSCSEWADHSKERDPNKIKVEFDVPALLNLSREAIIARLGEPRSSYQSPSFNTTLPTGKITIPSPTILDTYVVNGYGLQVYYIPEKCKKPIEFSIYDDWNKGNLDSTGLALLKKAYNLSDDTLLPSMVIKTPYSHGYNLVNVECQ